MLSEAAVLEWHEVKMDAGSPDKLLKSNVAREAAIPFIKWLKEAEEAEAEEEAGETTDKDLERKKKMQAAKKAKKARQQAKKREDAAGGSICTAQEEKEMERYFAEEAAALPCQAPGEDDVREAGEESALPSAN